MADLTTATRARGRTTNLRAPDTAALLGSRGAIPRDLDTPAEDRT